MNHTTRTFFRRAAAAFLAAVFCLCIPAAAAAAEQELPAAPSAPTTMGGANTTLIPVEEENCISWLFGSKDKITLPYLNIKGKGLRRNVTLDLVDCLVGITYTELGSIGSYVSSGAAQQAWKAQAVAIHSYLEYQKQYGSSANALIYTPVSSIPASTREAIRRAVEPVKNEVLVYNGSVCDAVWSASAGYNTQTGVYGTCASRDAWGTDVPTTFCAGASARTTHMWSTTTAVPVRPMSAPTPATKVWEGMCCTTPLCPTDAATATSTSSFRPGTASILAPTRAAPPA